MHRVLPAALALWFSIEAAAADISATLRGEVFDQDGLPVPGAQVRLSSPDLIGGQAEQPTDDLGRFRFSPLQPGTYALDVSHPSFAGWSTEGIRLEVGSTLAVQVSLAGVSEEVVIGGQRPVVDVEKVSTGLTLDKDFLRTIPSGRDYQGAAQLAPGVVGGGNPNMHGGFDSSNQYYIDGVNTTDPLTNTFSANLNWDAIESVEVLTGGMDAEYGRSMGGAINIVTKDGGNEFEGIVTLVYGNEKMILAPELPGDTRDESLEQEVNVNLGGPILRDKLWFYASAQANRYISSFSFDPAEIPRDTSRFPVQPERWRSVYLFGKLTARPSAQHRVWLTAQGDPTWIDNATQDPFTLPSAEEHVYQGGGIGSIGHQWMPSDRVLVETQLYAQRSIINATPMLWKQCADKGADGICNDDFVGSTYLGEEVQGQWYAWDADGFSVGAPAYASFNKRDRMSVQSSLRWFVDALGEHTVKVGAQAELLQSYQHYPGLAGGLEYWQHAGDPTDFSSYTPAQRIAYDNDWEATYRGTIMSAYAQDVYKPVPRLTLRPGVRMDLPNLRDDEGNKIFQRPTFAPRFGAAFDATGDGRTRIGAFYGRFYDTGFLAISDLLRKGSSGYAAYAWDERAGDWSTEPEYAVASTFLQHSDMRNPWSDEVNLSLARQVSADTSLQVTALHKKSQGFWEDDEVNLIWNAEGTDVIGNRNGENVAIYRLRTPPELYTTYSSIELLLSRRFSDRFGMIGSYAIARAQGTNSADQATGTWDIPEQRQYQKGLLDYDIPHNLKLTGSYAVDDALQLGDLGVGWHLGWDTQFRSGYPYRPVVWNDYYGDYANYDRPADGRYRLPAFTQTDLRAGLVFVHGEREYDLWVDVFNVFNDRTITSVNEAYDPTATADNQTFGAVIDRQAPRNMRVLLQGVF